MKKNKAAWITGICGIIAAIITCITGVKYGEYHQNKYIESQIAEVSGDGNTVVMNSVQDLVDEYNTLMEKYEKAEAERDQYYDDYSKALEDNESLQAQLDDSHVIQLKSLGLCIDGSEININKKNSYAIIDGSEYFSKDFMNNIVDQNKISMTIQNDTLYLGKVVTDSANLLSQRVVDSQNYKVVNNVIDSYGNTHVNVGRISNGGSVYYSLNEQYSLLKLSISIDEETYGDRYCIITIKADDEPVYISDSLDKVSTKKLELKDISIKNCSVLEISCSGDYDIYPIIYDAVVYN